MHHNIIYSYVLRSLYNILLNPKMMSLSRSLSSYIGITTIIVRGLAMYSFLKESMLCRYVVDERKKPTEKRRRYIIVCIVIDLIFGKNHLLYISWIADTFIPFYQHINYVDTLHKIFGLFFENVYLYQYINIYENNINHII